MSGAGSEFVLDEARPGRLGFGEAVYCAGKSAEQIAAILDAASAPMLLTLLSADKFAALPAGRQAKLDYDPVSRTAFSGAPAPLIAPAAIRRGHGGNFGRGGGA